ncbi:MAG: glycosyltransferase, partial [Myxococcales bacterium]|nr:glycosyltransferase [Myxococcales bacterium]
MTTSPLFELSIVVALKAPRGEDPLEGLAGWTQRQTCPRERYEVIVAANGDHPELEQRVPGVLGPNDRLLSPRPRLGTFGLLDLAAGAARGRWIQVSELHVFPEPECVEAMLAHLTAHDSPVAFGWSGGCGEGPLARGQLRYFREIMAASERTPEAPTFPVRTAAFRRDVLDKIGGIPTDYSLYADRILAARLKEAGLRATVVRDARFDHFDRMQLRGLRQDLSLYTWGEIRYRAASDAAYCDRHLGRPPEWAERDGYRRPIARMRRRTVARA